MNNRFKEIRLDNMLSMESYGERLGITRSSVSRIESGKHSLTGQMVKSVCREFGVNEEWLLTGNGEKYNISYDDYTRIVATIDRDDPKARNAILAYWSLSPEDKELFWKFIDRFLKEKN